MSDLVNPGHFTFGGRRAFLSLEALRAAGMTLFTALVLNAWIVWKEWDLQMFVHSSSTINAVSLAMPGFRVRGTVKLHIASLASAQISNPAASGLAIRTSLVTCAPLRWKYGSTAAACEPSPPFIMYGWLASLATPHGQ